MKAGFEDGFIDSTRHLIDAFLAGKARDAHSESGTRRLRIALAHRSQPASTVRSSG